MSNEPYEPSIEEIAEAARRIREQGYLFEGQQRPPWGEKRYGRVAELEFPVIESRGWWQK